jgi:hypothetical protein
MPAMLIQPSQADVRRFFCGVYAKTRGLTACGPALSLLEHQVSLWIDEHPQYHATLADLDAALRTMHEVDHDHDNPFLHLSMHLSISEQSSIDQPRGIRQALDLLSAKRQSLHAAHHDVMDCLGRMIFESQKKNKPPDGAAYLECVQRCATSI